MSKQIDFGDFVTMWRPLYPENKYNDIYSVINKKEFETIDLEKFILGKMECDLVL